MNEMNDLLSPEENAEENQPENTPLHLSILGSAQEFVERYTHCAFCGGHLHFTHITDFSKNLTHESARCPECGFKTHKAIHSLH